VKLGTPVGVSSPESGSGCHDEAMFPIRRAVPGDAGEVLTVQRAAFVTEAQLHDDVHMAPLTQTLEEVRAAVEASTVLVATDGPRIVGSVRAHAAEGAWHIGRLVVVPDLQGRGIGTALIEAIEQHAPADVDRFTVTTGPKSEPNIRLYQRLGYVQVPNDSILIRLTKQREPAS
jgi:predicted N-acetyltransferase YhbS